MNMLEEQENSVKKRLLMLVMATVLLVGCGGNTDSDNLNIGLEE